MEFLTIEMLKTFAGLAGATWLIVAALRYVWKKIPSDIIPLVTLGVGVGLLALAKGAELVTISDWVMLIINGALCGLSATGFNEVVKNRDK